MLRKALVMKMDWIKDLLKKLRAGKDDLDGGREKCYK